MDAVGVPSLMPRTIDQSNAEHGQYPAAQGAVGNAGGRGGRLARAFLQAGYACHRAVVRRRSGGLARRGRPQASSAGIRWPWRKRARSLGDVIDYAPSAEECLSQSSVAIIINPMKEFAGIDWSAACEDARARSVAVPCPGGSRKDRDLRGARPRKRSLGPRMAVRRSEGTDAPLKRLKSAPAVR